MITPEFIGSAAKRIYGQIKGIDGIEEEAGLHKQYYAVCDRVPDKVNLEIKIQRIEHGLWLVSHNTLMSYVLRHRGFGVLWDWVE